MEQGKRVECPPSNITNANQNESSLFCPYYTDPVICWPTTSSGSLAVVRCPEKFNGILLYPGNASRFCYDNGTWQEKANYSQCLHNLTAENINVHNYIYIIIYYVGFSVSVVALSIALFLFLFFRCLRCLRNTIHCNLIAVFILKHLLYLKMVVTMPIIIIHHEANSPLHEWMCKLTFTFFNYLLVSSFFWMLIEGLYLHTILVWSFSHEGLKFFHCAIIGWCVPAIFAVAWAIVRWREENDSDEFETATGILNLSLFAIVLWFLTAISSDAMTLFCLTVELLELGAPLLCLNAINENTGSKYEYYDYICIVPIYTVLLVNAIFLASVVWILWTKLKASSSSQHMLYRKTTKASLILFPLLGVTYLLFYSAAKQIVLAYVNVFLQSFQGLFVAIFYCFLNYEVQSMVKRWLSHWHDGRNMSSRTQTSTVVVSEQMSLHCSTVKDDVQSKTKGILRQGNNREFSGRERPDAVDKGYHVNGFDSEQSKKSLLRVQDKEHTPGCEDGKTGAGFRQYDLDAEKDDFEYILTRQQAKSEDEEDEQDIIKEDLV